MRTFSIRTHILWLVLAVSIPLIAIVGYEIYDDMQQTVTQTKASLRMVASTMVRNTGARISDTRKMLELLATRPLVMRVDPKNCDEILKDLRYLIPGYANVGYADMKGEVVCSAVPQPGGKLANIGQTKWFKKFMKEKDFSIGEPFFGPITGKWVSVLSAPIWNERHEMVGAILIPLDLSAYDPKIPDQLLPPGSQYGFFSDDGVLVWRNVDPQHTIGTRPKAEAAKKIVAVRDGEFASVASDGVSRFYSAMPMQESSLIAWVGVPVEAIYAEAKRRAIFATSITLGIMVLLYLIATAIARKITSPVVDLARVARAVHDGDLGVRAAVGGPSDLATVAQEFNAMVDAHQRNVAQLRVSAAAFESQESLIITDANTVILRVNQAFTRNTGYTPEEAIGRTPRILQSGRHNADFYRAMWATIARTGTWQGEVWDRRKNGELYLIWLTISAVKADDGVITHYVGSHIDITERKASEEKIRQLAFHDPLTRLPNRQLLLDRLQRGLLASGRSGHMGALLFIDLDNFKTLNDTLGHLIGDLLLIQVAERLSTCVREGDTVARLGGDEFVVLLENLSEQATEAATQTEAIGEKILHNLSMPYELELSEYRCTTSIGATMFNGHQGATEDLLKQADIAMYQAKRAGRNALRFFDPQMQKTINSRAALENDLRKALDNGQLHLHYQIQVDNARRPLGAEALLRWSHPEHGLVSPAHFIPLAEETGLILPIGQWVLEAACAQLKSWEHDSLTRDLVLAVNVSAREFRQNNYVAQVQASVQRHGINPKLLKIELTESFFLEKIEDIISTMNALNEIGVQFSLDDFGTGYSSLQYLKRLPLDQLKIDQSFVRDIAVDSDDKEIVRTIIAMARSLNLDVIAEGVETEEQSQLLLESGCSRQQGYLFGRPVSIEKFEASLIVNDAIPEPRPI